MDKFEDFKKKEKFIEDITIFYPGIADISLRPVLEEIINQTADDLKKVFLKQNTSDKDYQEQIKKHLERFHDLYLDTEDKERICQYIQELMDIIGLASSDGLLNNFLYGFDPNDLKNYHQPSK